METSGQSDRKVMNSSPISGLTVNLHGSVESVGSNIDMLSKSPVLNRSPLAQDEWQKKLYKNKGIELSLNNFDLKLCWENIIRTHFSR